MQNKALWYSPELIDQLMKIPVEEDLCKDEVIKQLVKALQLARDHVPDAELIYIDAALAKANNQPVG